MERSAEKPLRHPLLISFSGVDGSGKSTQIENLCTALHKAGLRTRRLTFWDNVVFAVKYREGFVHAVYKSERGIGAPGRPVNRRDKNMRGLHLTVARHFLYLLDALSLCLVVLRERRQRTGLEAENDVIVFDRYVYDELANLNLHRGFSRIFAKLIHRFVPRPDIAYLLDADPAAAYARKPEYPLDFMTKCRQSYLDLAALLGNMTLVPVQAEPEARLAVLKLAEDRLLAAGCSLSEISSGARDPYSLK
jgi:thymidylate kinase